MELVWGLLAFLPLERLLQLQLERPQSSLYGDRLFEVRLRVFNRLSPELLGLVPGSTFVEKYTALATYQGELSHMAPAYLSANVLARRAASIQETEWYNYFTSIDRQRIGQLEALKSGVPAIQARLLAMYSVGRYYFPRIFDPRGIAWTNGLAKVLYPLIEKKTDIGMFETAGYLNKGQRKTAVDAFLRGGALYLGLKNPDPFLAVPGRSLRWQIQAGDYSRHPNDTRGAFGQVDVRAIQIYLRKNPTAILRAIEAPDIPEHISEYLCRKAYAMYLLAEADRRLILDEPYLTYIKVLAGLPVEIPSTPTPYFEQNDVDTLLDIAMHVAHPDLPPANDSWEASFRPRMSEVFYDLPGLLRKYPELHWSEESMDDIVGFLHSRGQLLKCLADPRVAEFLRNHRSGTTPGKDSALEAEYQRILPILLADQTPL